MKLCLLSGLSYSSGKGTARAINHMLYMSNAENPNMCFLSEFSCPKDKNHFVRYSTSCYWYMNGGNSKENFEMAKKYCDIFVIPGGNTFQIASIMQNNGFYDVIKELAQIGKIIVGTSAGAIIMSPTILTAQWADKIGESIDTLKTMDGIGLVNFMVKPHSEWYFPRYTTTFQNFSTIKKKKFECIGDDGGIVINDDKMYKYGFVKTIRPGC